MEVGSRGRIEVDLPPKTTPLAKKLDCAVMGPTEEAYDQNTPYEEQIIAVLKDARAGSVFRTVSEHGISDATFYEWRTKYAGLEVSDVKNCASWKTKSAAEAEGGRASAEVTSFVWTECSVP